MSNNPYQQLPQPLLANQHAAPGQDNTTSVVPPAAEHVAVSIDQPAQYQGAVQGQPMYPVVGQQQQYPAAGAPGYYIPPPSAVYYGGQYDQLVLTMPARVSVGIKLLFLFALALYVGLAITYYYLGVFGDLWWLWLVFAGVLAIIFWARWPKAADISMQGVSVHLNATTYSMLYQNMSAIIIVKNACCWSGAACDFPRSVSDLSSHLKLRIIDIPNH
jgi:hypothetical protein